MAATIPIASPVPVIRAEYLSMARTMSDWLSPSAIQQAQHLRARCQFVIDDRVHRANAGNRLLRIYGPNGLLQLLRQAERVARRKDRAHKGNE